MTYLDSAALNGLFEERDGVLDTRTVLSRISPEALRWRIKSGRWQQPCRGVVVAHSGPLTGPQRLWVAALWAGSGSAIAGLTALRLGGLRGFDRDKETIHLLRPVSRKERTTAPALDLAVHYSRKLGEADVHPALRPVRTRMSRSLVDAAAWMATDRGARAILAAGVQQRLVRVSDLLHQVERNEKLPRRALIKVTLGDIEGGSQALSELDFMASVVRGCHLPAPTRQVSRRDSHGKRRWLDVFYEEARLAIEIDGAGHLDILEYWDNMARDNDLKIAGYTVLRFPAYIVRYYPELVATKIREALRTAGIRI
jgi:hypothetical protein